MPNTAITAFTNHQIVVGRKMKIF